MNIFEEFYEKEDKVEIHNRVRNYFKSKQNKWNSEDIKKIMQYSPSGSLERLNHPKRVILNDFHESIKLSFYLTISMRNIYSQIAAINHELDEWHYKYSKHKEIERTLQVIENPGGLKKLSEIIFGQDEMQKRKKHL